uniref:SH2 domain-containing protein n=1 Tax=Macrostomum lignano TaxID=282301 RepID=A0A1I8JMN1_9PLAT
MTGLCLCVRFKGLLHGRVKAPDPEAEVGAGRGGGDGGGGGRSSCASSGNNNSSGLAKNGKLPPADWRRSGGNHENHSYYSRGTRPARTSTSPQAPSAGEAAAAATTAVRQDPRQSAIGRRLSGLRASFLARLRRSICPELRRATSGDKEADGCSAAAKAGVAVVHPQPAGGPRAATGAPSSSRPCRRRRRSRRRAATGRSLLKRHLQDFPLPGIATGSASAAPPPRLPQPPRPPGNPRNTLPAATAAPAPAPRANASPRLPRPPRCTPSTATSPARSTPLYSAIRRHSARGQDEPATATPTPVARRRHAVEPPQQQQHVYASICKTLPSSLNNTADSASPMPQLRPPRLPGRAVGQQRRRWGRSAPPLPSRNYRREEVDRILQEPAAYYSNIDLRLCRLRVGGRWEASTLSQSGLNQRGWAEGLRLTGIGLIDSDSDREDREGDKSPCQAGSGGQGGQLRSQGSAVPARGLSAAAPVQSNSASGAG